MLLPENGPPVGPGEILQEEFLTPMGITQREFAEHLGWPQPKLNEIIKGKRGVTPETALAFADAFGTTPEFWLNAQRACDLWEAIQSHKTIPRLQQAS
jgi:addiction module HigA family antidote